MKLYVIRHGQSETNLRGEWTGWMDAALTEQGIKDAEKAKCALQGISFDRVYSSDLRRAMHTAAVALPDCIAETTSLLREISVGSLAGRHASVLSAEERQRHLKYGFEAFGGEPREVFHTRLRQFLTQMEQTSGQTIAAFAHAGVLRALMDMVVGVRLPHSSILCNNCAIVVFEYKEQKWYLHSLINL